MGDLNHSKKTSEYFEKFTGTGLEFLKKTKEEFKTLMSATQVEEVWRISSNFREEGENRLIFLFFPFFKRDLRFSKSSQNHLKIISKLKDYNN